MKKFYIVMMLLAYCLQQVSAQNANRSLSNLTSPTAVNVDLLPKTDDSLNLGNAAKSWKDIYADGSLYLGGARFLAYKTGTGAGNTAVGAATLNGNTSGTNNTAAGFNALYRNTTGKYNTGVGYKSLYSNKSGTFNAVGGYQALFSNTSGTANTANGVDALYSNTTGTYNAASGAYALYTNNSGSYNTAIGPWASYYNVKGYSNVAIGVDALYKNTDGHNLVAIGDSALFNQAIDPYNDYENTAIGSKALYSNTTGEGNTANGSYSLFENATGLANTAIGVEAMEYSEEDSFNVAIGADAMGEVDGSNNVAIGADAMGEADGSNNVAIGSNAMFFSFLSSNNIAIGVEALYNATGSGFVAVGDSALYTLYGGNGHCTALGSEAGWKNTTGSNNTYLGYHAGNTVTDGSSNTIIGYGADISDGSFNNSTALGNLAVANASNKVRIGNSSVTSIGGQVSWTTGSDERIKTNIKQNVPGLQFINLLKPVTYSYDVDKEDAFNGIADKEKPAGKYDIQKIQFTGFLAQEVEKAAKQINYDFSGVDVPKNDKDIYGLRYSDFVVPLVKAVQELSVQNDSLKKQNDAQQKINTDQQKQIDDLRNLVLQIQQTQQQCSPCNAAATSNAIQQNNITLNKAGSLEQNIPNPFTNTTTIGYSFPNKFSSAKIVITDKNGKQLKQLNITGAGKGTIHVDASTLASGAYNYSLYVDGRLITSKQMILTK